ncbi:MAG: hypothetical protein ACYDEQ_02200 [Desulfocucumaceae bacterium]
MKIMKYPLQINNLKFLCSYLSTQHAILLAKEKGIIVDTYQDYISIDKHRKIMKYAAAAGFEFEDFNSQHIEGYSVVRIYKEAPILFQLINYMDKYFKVIVQPFKYNHEPFSLVHLSTLYSHSASFPAIIKRAYYFMTSWNLWTVDPRSKTLTSREGYNLGLSNLRDRTVSYNIEFQINLELLLHEIVHQKGSPWGEKVVREATALVAKDCTSFLKKVEGLTTNLNSEITRIARDFARFDYKVGQILGINETAKKPQIDRLLPLTLSLAYGECSKE